MQWLLHFDPPCRRRMRWRLPPAHTPATFGCTEKKVNSTRGGSIRIEKRSCKSELQHKHDQKTFRCLLITSDHSGNTVRWPLQSSTSGGCFAGFRWSESQGSLAASNHPKPFKPTCSSSGMKRSPIQLVTGYTFFWPMLFLELPPKMAHYKLRNCLFVRLWARRWWCTWNLSCKWNLQLQLTYRDSNSWVSVFLHPTRLWYLRYSLPHRCGRWGWQWSGAVVPWPGGLAVEATFGRCTPPKNSDVL